MSNQAIQKAILEERSLTEKDVATTPDPLRAEVGPPEPYPVEALGDTLGSAVLALNKTIKAPIELCAQSVLAAASFAVQAHFDVGMPWGEVKPTTLFFLTIGESGERKSGVDSAVLGAAKKQEREDMEQYQVVFQDYETKLQAWKDAFESAKAKAKKGKAGKADFESAYAEVGDKPEAPLMPLRFVSDPTVEGLFKLLAVSQPSVALFSDEGGLLIGGHAMNSENVLKTISRWCKLWDGSPYDRVRAGDGTGILYGRRMALHQLAQPEVMSGLLASQLANGQGFLARCLVAWPQSTIGSRQVASFVNPNDQPELRRLYGKLKTIFETQPITNPKNERELQPTVLSLSTEAEEVAIFASNEFEGLMKPGKILAEIKDRTCKAMDNALRLAAVLAVMDEGMACRQISDDHLHRSLEIIQWYLKEALRIKTDSWVPQEVIDAEALLAWIKDRELKYFRSKQVLKGGPNQIRNKARLDKAIHVLDEAGYLEQNKEGFEVDGVKAKRSWKVNAHVF